MKHKLEKLKIFLIKNFVFFEENLNLEFNTYFKSGGVAKLFVSPQTLGKLEMLIGFLSIEHIEFKLIGNTSNIMFINEVDYSVIVSTKNLREVDINDTVISVEAGYLVSDFVRVTLMREAEGFEGLEGIPASIGGALFMNAGAYGCCISDNLISVSCLNESGQLIVLSKKDCEFGYRHSIFMREKLIILEAKFSLSYANQDLIAKKIEIFHIARHTYQDFVYPNLGSMISLSNLYLEIFSNNKKYLLAYWFLRVIYKNPLSKFIYRKNPNNKAFNRLLLKYVRRDHGFSINYTPSHKNSNTLINNGKASTGDIIKYMYDMHSLVDSKYSIENEVVLEPAYRLRDDS